MTPFHCPAFRSKPNLVVGRGAGKLSTFNLQLSTAAKAGALVLLVGFWFDGGLFKLATGAVF
ncbi:MAG TPA: hypothetical protein VFZ59_23665 [Verrucomicrobiae bacterium]|nr:hypothetical protein [Verrucomicrobiae bacterium]